MVITECLIQPKRDPGDPNLLGGVGVICVNPGDSEALCKRAKEQGGKRYFLYNSKLWVVRNDDFVFAVCGPSIGAPMAVMVLEKLIALGVKKVIVFGCCGSLTRQLDVGNVLLPTWAISEEGVSGHYPLQERPISDGSLREDLVQFLVKQGQTTCQGPIWTTDAPYRETVEKVSKHKALGAMAVDMEFSALIAVAAFRKIKIAALMVVSDLLTSEGWKPGFQSKLFKNRIKSMRKLIFNYCLQGNDE